MIPVRVSRTTSIKLPPPSIIEGTLDAHFEKSRSNQGHNTFSFKYMQKSVYKLEVDMNSVCASQQIVKTYVLSLFLDTLYV